MSSPKQTFEDTMRPADLLLRVYRLLNAQDVIHTQGELVEKLRGIVAAGDDEYLMVLYNEIFLGIVRESAEMKVTDFRKAKLRHLLRQAVVVACTAMESYLPSLLRENIPTVIRAVGRDFVPVNDGDVTSYLKNLQFSLAETLRLLDDPNAPEFIANRIINLLQFSYLSSRKGIHFTGRLLGIDQPWDRIASHLTRDKNELTKILTATVERRNDIVHRGDKAQGNPEGEVQEITYAWTRQAVDTISHVCLALDSLVAARMVEYEAAAREREALMLPAELAS